MEFQEILSSFAAKMGGTVELTPDEDGAVALDVDGMPVTFLHLPDLGQVVLSGVVGTPPPQDKIELLYRAMLQANDNFTGTFGATLSLHPETGEVRLCKALSLSLLDGESFFAEVEHFVNTLSTWRTAVVDFRGEAPGDPSAGHGGGADEPFGSGTFDLDGLLRA